VKQIRSFLETGLDISVIMMALLSVAAIVGIVGLVFVRGDPSFLLGATGGLVAALAALLGAVFIWVQSRRDRLRRLADQRLSEPELLGAARRLTQTRVIESLLQAACAEVAEALAIDASRIRANVFYLSADGKLHMVPGFTWNMDHPQELELVVPVGSGAAGQSFATGRPYVTVLGDQRWGRTLTSPDQISRIHPDLKWIISVPIGSTTEPLLVLNVHGLEKREAGELGNCVPRLLYWAFTLLLVVQGLARPSQEGAILHGYQPN
jgi:hypothetical protein